jgi:hypothetical protein
MQIMKDVGGISLNASKSVIYNSSRVQGCNWFFFTFTCDPTNIWLQ